MTIDDMRRIAKARMMMSGLELILNAGWNDQSTPVMRRKIATAPAICL